MTKLGITPFTKQQRYFLKEYEMILRPIATALDNMQGSKCPYAVVLPTLNLTEEKLRKLKTDDNLVVCKPLLNAVINGFEKRFKLIMDFSSQKAVPALIATICHPHFKLRWIAPDKKTTVNIEKLTNIVVQAADEISMENWSNFLSKQQSSVTSAETSIQQSTVSSNDLIGIEITTGFTDESGNFALFIFELINFVMKIIFRET